MYLQLSYDSVLMFSSVQYTAVTKNAFISYFYLSVIFNVNFYETTHHII